MDENIWVLRADLQTKRDVLSNSGRGGGELVDAEQEKDLAP